MKKKMLYVFGSIILVIIGVAGFVMFNMTHFTVLPSVIAIRSIEISSKVIDVSGYFSASSLWSAGYKTEYSNENLYIRIIGSGINYSHLNGDVNLSIPNNYGNIKAVYLVGGQDGGVMIWPDNKTLRQSPQ